MQGLQLRSQRDIVAAEFPPLRGAISSLERLWAENQSMTKLCDLGKKIRLTHLKYMVHTPPPSAKLLSLPCPPGLSATEEEHRAGILGLSCWI